MGARIEREISMTERWIAEGAGDAAAAAGDGRGRKRGVAEIDYRIVDVELVNR
jgi:hypothetical protein